MSAVSPAISRSVSLFEILRVFLRFSRFFEILRDFRYFSFLFSSSKVKNHICILWNPNICFNNNNNLTEGLNGTNRIESGTLDLICFLWVICPYCDDDIKNEMLENI